MMMLVFRVDHSNSSTNGSILVSAEGPRGLALPERSLGLIDQELDVPLRLCKQFAEKVERFFERLFKAAGLPNRFGRLGAG